MRRKNRVSTSVEAKSDNSAEIVESATLLFDSEEAVEAERHEASSLSNMLSLGGGNFRTLPRFSHD